MSELEKAQAKFIRLQNEQSRTLTEERQERDEIPFGQPKIVGRKDIYKRADQLAEKAHKLDHEIQAQHDRVKMLEAAAAYQSKTGVQDVHRVGKSEYASIGAATSVRNLDYFKKELADLETYNEKAKANNRKKGARKMQTVGAKITKLKRKIEALETMQEKTENQKISDKAQGLIEAGKVTQWAKKPIYYFVKGLRKVAVEIDNSGNFVESSRYPATTASDQQALAALIK